MRKFLQVFLFCITLSAATYSQVLFGGCSKQAPKISFSGKAPWAIDGKITDWMKILGPYPFHPPATSAFNWSSDQYLLPITRPDTPKPASDISILAFTHDDYNVYFYFRREQNGSSPNTFYYFFDVNGDAVMNTGEPVIHASFTNKAISPLTLGLYVPDKDTGYFQPKKGNWLGVGTFGGPFAQSVHAHSMPGDVVDIFNSEYNLFPVKLKKHEIFKAALTEDGYGLELAIPWRYLRNWLTLKKSLDPGNIFFYKLSMQEGRGSYNPKKIVDNAGSCRGGPGISGSPQLDKSLATTTLVPGSAYRFKLGYTNLTNAATEIGLERINLDFTPNTGLPPAVNNVAMTVYADNNCNGIVDGGETAVNYLGRNSTSDSCCHFSFQRDVFGSQAGIVVVPPPFGKGCFIVDLAFPPDQAVSKFKINFNTSVFFVEGREPCEPSCGSKPINVVGYMEAQFGSDQLAGDGQKNSMLQAAPINSDFVLYPNPSRGITNLALPESADISVVDNMGRNVQTINKAKAGIIQLKDLKAGFYIVKVRFAGSGKVMTKKLFIQP